MTVVKKITPTLTDLRNIYFALRSKNKPWWYLPFTIIVTLFTCLYAVIPIDIISDFIPIIGFVDDAFIAYIVFLMLKFEAEIILKIKPDTK